MEVRYKENKYEENVKAGGRSRDREIRSRISAKEH
jgi:hypothetical protein